ncbi:MAG: hypothetical protein Q4C42_05185 [Clostridia bacterium]|nr:hypothetical protein [Clostridia bacterium]
MIELLKFLGIPGLFTAAVLGLWGWSKAKFKEQSKEYGALKAGMQALLRDRLLQGWKHYSKQGYADTDDKDNWVNMYNQYKALGGNGVVTAIHGKVLALPDFPPQEGD